jgi:glucose 1-dehydrogenase
VTANMKGKVVAVTGAGRGIGRATAQAFARVGATVVVSDVVQAELVQTAALIASAHQDCQSVLADVSRRSDVDGLVEKCLELGGLDVMVANAGVSLDRAFLEVTEEDLDTTFSVNLKGVFFCGQAAARAMIRLGRGGSIINITSIYGDAAADGCSAYGASKGGVTVLTKVMALELGGHGIRVNAVGPGFIRTAMNPMDDAAQVRQIEASVPLGRVGLPEDIAGVITWLASDEARYVDGQAIYVDGGWNAQ